MQIKRIVPRELITPAQALRASARSYKHRHAMRAEAMTLDN